MAKSDQVQNESISKGNSEDSLLVIYIFDILKKYSSPQSHLSSQDVMEHLREDYSPLLRIPPLIYLEVDEKVVEALGIENIKKQHPEAKIFVKQNVEN